MNVVQPIEFLFSDLAQSTIALLNPRLAPHCSASVKHMIGVKLPLDFLQGWIVAAIESRLPVELLPIPLVEVGTAIRGDCSQARYKNVGHQ